MGGYDSELGRRESENAIAEIFEAEFPKVTGRNVQILEKSESPDYIAQIDDVETGVELTAIHAAGADEIVFEFLRLSEQKHSSYERRGLFVRPIILLGHLDWPAPEVEGLALYDVHRNLEKRAEASAFTGLRFSEIWLMDAGPKYTSRRDPRAPADFFCFKPKEQFGFWGCERKRRPYWGLWADY